MTNEISNTAVGKKQLFKNFIKERSTILKEIFVVLVFFFGRFLVYGFQYFPQLTDYQYFGNSASTVDSLILNKHFFASLLNNSVWSNLWDHLILVVLFQSVVFSISCVLLFRIFRKLFGTGYIFLFVLTLMPMSLDGLYWLSSSSMIIPAVFFTSLSALLCYQLMTKGNIIYIVLFTLAQLCVYGFWEQFAIVSVLICLLIAIKLRNKNIMAMLLLAANFLIYYLYEILYRFALSQSAIPINTDIIAQRFLQLLSAIRGFLPDIIVKAFWRGLKYIWIDKLIVYPILVVLLCVLLFILLKKYKVSASCTPSQTAYLMVWSLLLFLTPLMLLLFFVDGEIGLKSVVPSLCGAALFIDTFARLVFRRGKRFYPIILTLLVFVFCISSISEIADYKCVTDYDVDTGTQIVSGILDKSEYKTSTNIAVINLSNKPLKEQNYSFSTHIKSSLLNVNTTSGLLSQLSKYPSIPQIMIIDVSQEDGLFYFPQQEKPLKIEDYDKIFVYVDGEFISVKAVQGFTEQDYDPYANYTSYLLYSQDLTRIARVAEYSDHGVFRLY